MPLPSAWRSVVAEVSWRSLLVVANAGFNAGRRRGLRNMSRERASRRDVRRDQR